MVWDETIRVVTELFDDVWAGRQLIVVDNVLDITLAVGGIALISDRVKLTSLCPFLDYAVHHQHSWFWEADLMVG